MNWGSRTRLRFPLLVALALHAALLWFAVGTSSRVAPTPFRDVPSDGVVWLEESTPLEPAPAPVAPQASAPEPLPSGEELARAVPRSLSNERDETFPAAPAADESTGAVPERLASPEHSGSSVPEGLPGGAGPAGGDSPQAGGPRLSLQQLGVGETNPFLPKLPAPERPKDRTRAFKRALATELVAADQRAGLGPEGPVLKRLQEEARKTTTAASSTARFRATTDHAGRVTSFDLLDATDDHRVWEALARRLLTGLAGITLHVPKTGHGVTMDMKVSSEMQLPSGADPGMGVEIAGIDVKKSGGKRSPKLTVLKPKPRIQMREITLPDGHTMTVPVIELMEYLNLAGDPTDIGKKPQRVVHARLERLWANSEPAAAPAN